MVTLSYSVSWLLVTKCNSYTIVSNPSSLYQVSTVYRPGCTKLKMVKYDE